MARKIAPKAEVEVNLVELVENHDHGAIRIHTRQSTYPLAGVLCSVVDMKEITIDYQDVVLVEQTLLRSARGADANCLSTAQQLVHGVAHVVGARCGLKLVILRRDLLDSFNALRSKSTIVVAYENRTGHFDEPLDI